MKKFIPILIILTAIFSSCGRMHKAEKVPPPPPPVSGNISEGDPVTDEKPITEVKEKVEPAEKIRKAELTHHYYVIIGSFRHPDNARKYQEQIASEGFTSVLLRNEQGLYRVSVMSTDDINEARNQIRSIRNRFPDHQDTWLLISVK